MSMWVECADSKRRPVFMDNDHVLLRLYSEVMAGTRQRVPGKDGKMQSRMVYDHADTRIFQILEGAGDDKQRWDPRALHLWNVIDRDDDWCRRNKHCKILTTSEKNKGFGPMVWGGRRGKGGIQFVIRENKPDSPEDYDIKVVRTGKGLDTDYQIAVPNPGRAANSTAVAGALKKTEREYGQYDLNALVPITPSERVVEWLADTIKQADADLGTDYCVELGLKARAKKKKGKSKK